MNVITAEGECKPFRSDKIRETLIVESGLTEEHAEKIKKRIVRKIKMFRDNGIDTLSTHQIRTMAQTHLMNDGKFDEEEKYERLGMPMASIESLIQHGSNDNANIAKNPEAIHKYVADESLKQYALRLLPKELRKAHISGDLHTHDLEFFASRPLNCLQHDARFFIKNGTMVDGSGEHTSVAKQANNVETLMNHLGQAMMASQVNMSGGQSMPLFNVFVAPYVRGLPYKRIKQAMQMFIYNLNMSYVSRGGQSVFSSINLEFTVPDFLKNETAYGPGGKEVGVYGDYEEETRTILRAITEVLFEGDAMGKPHLFPNTIYVLREEMMGDEFEEDLRKVHELSAKYSTPYFANCLPGWTGGHSNVMGCRTRLNTNWTNDWDLDTLRTGNLAYITINLPRLAYKTNTEADFYKELESVLNKAKEILLIRRDIALKALHEYKNLEFLTQKDENGEEYYRIENATLSFGIGGLDECLRAKGFKNGLLGEGGRIHAKGILNFINKYASQLSESTGLRWTILQTPGETTMHRFATLDKEKYPDKAIVNGNEGNYYYTNSSHVPVNSDATLINRVLYEGWTHPLTSGGHIFHAFLGEKFPDIDALMSLTKKLARTNLGFWAYSSAFSYCFSCYNFEKGLIEKCSSCGSVDDVEWYDRITGYVQQVGHKKDSSGGWNAGKKQELVDRCRYDV